MNEWVIPLLTGWMAGIAWHGQGDPRFRSGTLVQQPSWASLKKVVGGGVTPEYRPSEREFARLPALGTRRLRLINIDSRRVGMDSVGNMLVAWSPHLQEGLRACRDHGWIPRIIIGQTLPDSGMMRLPGGDEPDSTFWATYRQYVHEMVQYVVGEWGFGESEWEVGNEMDVPASNWLVKARNGSGADSLRFARYMRLYREISSVLAEYRRSHPGVRLRIGGPAVTPGAFLDARPQSNWVLRFVDEVARNGSTIACDFVSFHLYGNSASGLEAVAAVQRLRERMRMDRVSLAISVSEWGPSWLGDANLNLAPIAGAFALDFVRVVADAGIDDAFFLALSEFPKLKWPVLFDSTESPTHAMIALQMLAELHGARGLCTVERTGSRCLAAINRDSVDVVFWTFDWAAGRVPDRDFPRGQDVDRETIVHAAVAGARPTGVRLLELQINGRSINPANVSVAISGSVLTTRFGTLVGVGSYGKARLMLSFDSIGKP